MIIGKKNFELTGHTYVMGILNVTPDSFSDGGKWNRLDEAFAHAEEMIRAGADLIDVGGESTRPGYTAISEEEEIERVAPVLEALKARFDIPLSLDTYKAKVAREGIRAGADLINDIWGLKYDPQMAEVIAQNAVPCCLMHNRADASYEDFWAQLRSDLEESVGIARRAGIKADRIILDPGVGFAKTYENNLEVIANLEKLKDLGYPLLLGCSRKSVIGLTLGLPVEERLEGTLVTTVWAVLKGCSFVRVHDVEENVRAIRMAETLKRYAEGKDCF